MSETTTEYVGNVRYKVRDANRYHAEEVEVECTWKPGVRTGDPADRTDDVLVETRISKLEEALVLESFRTYYPDCKDVTDATILDAFRDAVHTIIEERGRR